MGSSTPKIQQPVVQPTPKVTDKAIQETVAESIRRRSRGQGYRNTILSKTFLDDRASALMDTFGS